MTTIETMVRAAMLWDMGMQVQADQLIGYARNGERLKKGAVRYEKRCARCGLVKGLEDFVKDATRADGRMSYCINCKKVRNKESYTIDKQRDRVRLYTEKYEQGRTVHPDTKKCSRCKKIKTTDHFYIRRGSSDGLQSNCIVCTADTFEESQKRLRGRR